MQPLLGQIQSFGFNFAPRGWAICEGQILSISQNQSLYSLLGTTYGGDGRTTFALPDLRGRTSFGFGQGSGLSNHPIGQKSGETTHTLTVPEMPSHNHSARAVAEAPNAEKSTGTLLATPSPTIYSSAAPDASLNAAAISNNGGGQAHNNMQPYLVINWCIALQGLFPSRS